MKKCMRINKGKRFTIRSKEQRRNEDNELVLAKKKPQRGYRPHLINRERKLLSSNLYGVVDSNSLKTTDGLKFVRNTKMNAYLLKESSSNPRDLK